MLLEGHLVGKALNYFAKRRHCLFWATDDCKDTIMFVREAPPPFCVLVGVRRAIFVDWIACALGTVF